MLLNNSDVWHSDEGSFEDTNIFSLLESRGNLIGRLQEHKLLWSWEDLRQAEEAIAERTGAGLAYNTAAGTVYEELGERVDDLESWGRYMALDGSERDEHVVVTLQYVEEGLLSVEVCQGQGAFGDDFSIEVLATEYQRDIYVVSSTATLLPHISRWSFLLHAAPFFYEQKRARFESLQGVQG